MMCNGAMVLHLPLRASSLHSNPTSLIPQHPHCPICWSFAIRLFHSSIHALLIVSDILSILGGLSWCGAGRKIFNNVHNCWIFVCFEHECQYFGDQLSWTLIQNAYLSMCGFVDQFVSNFGSGGLVEFVV